MNAEPEQQSKWKYEKTVIEVEEIIARIESGSLSLEEVFEQFAIATDLLKQCESFLAIGSEKMDLAIEVLEREEEIEF
jgi:exodeoxyribonuclease VII small subunit